MIFTTRALLRCLPQINNLITNNVVYKKTANLSNIHRCFSASTTLWGRKFSEKHEWVTVDGTIATIGISDYAQDNLGDLTFADFPEVGRVLERDASCGTVESVKSVSEIYSPVSGTVVERNEDALETPALINQSCYDKGWLFKVSLKDKEELRHLLNEEEYKQFLDGGEH